MLVLYVSFYHLRAEASHLSILETVFWDSLDGSSFKKVLVIYNFFTKDVKNKKLEEFISTELFSNKQFNSKDIVESNNFTLINIWSSWCIPCRSEHGKLMNLSKKTDLNIVGLNYKDKKINAIKFLNELGNAFSKNLIDPDGIISISLGAYGVPESFLLNNKSRIICLLYTSPSPRDS